MQSCMQGVASCCMRGLIPDCSHQRNAIVQAVRCFRCCLQGELATLRHCMGFGLALRQLRPAGQLAVFRSQVSFSASQEVSSSPRCASP